VITHFVCFHITLQILLLLLLLLLSVILPTATTTTADTNGQLPACLGGVKAGHIHLCRVAENTVIPYG